MAATYNLAEEIEECGKEQIPIVLFVRDFLEPRIQAIRVEEAFHDPTGHDGYWTGFNEGVENRWKHSG